MDGPLGGAILMPRPLAEVVYTISANRDAFQKLKPGLRQILLNGLAPAA